MNKIDTFSNRLKKALSIKNMKQIELSEKSGIGKSAISQYLSGSFEAKQNALYLLAQALNVSEAWLMGYDVPMEKNKPNIINCDTIQVNQTPILGKISAGLPIEAQEEIIGYTFIDKKDSKDYFALQINGDSMNNIAKDKSTVIVKKQNHLENGEIGVILVNGYDATVKRFKQDGYTIILIPDSNNNEHMPQVYNLKNIDIKILGKVVQVVINI